MGHVKWGLRGAAKSIPDTRRALRSASISVAECCQEVQEIGGREEPVLEKPVLKVWQKELLEIM